ncbi:DUF4974 domain-containing protein [Segatella albensis]|jgi:hypothetical protein|uniref:DUF4974 domain-containing protein n=1 Tax=Segatella albensis TaxID=77768 RepID=UPI0004879B20|nr:DUF4974 domain-containing protein [Segatella albensis]
METTKEREQNQTNLSSVERKEVRHSQMTNENIRELLEMLDNPDAYTDQEIQDIINRDEDTCDTYSLMVEAKRSSRHRQNRKSVDVDAAWQRFNQKRQSKQHGFDWMKIAVFFIGALLVSGITFAAIHIIRQYQRTGVPQNDITENVTQTTTTIPVDTLTKDTVTVQPVIYDNIPLEKMLPEIAVHYNVKVVFVNNESRQLRFRFVWNPQQGIDQVISDLNQFERLTITRKDNQITVE